MQRLRHDGRYSALQARRASAVWRLLLALLDWQAVALRLD